MEQFDAALKNENMKQAMDATRDSKKAITLQRAAWLLCGAVIVLAVFAWGQNLQWQFSTAISYQFFPLFGLIAFSLMWSHYILGYAREKMHISKETLRPYFRTTSAVVLAALLLHPGVLVWQLWQDGFGLPPQSYLQNYVAPAMGLAATLGLICLGVFLTYELWRWYEKRSWWKYVSGANDVAMLAIIFHGLQLGGALRIGWYRGLWFFYGASLIGVLAYKYTRMYTKNSHEA